MMASKEGGKRELVNNLEDYGTDEKVK